MKTAGCGLLLFLALVAATCSPRRAADAKQYLYTYGHLTSMESVDGDAMRAALKEFQRSVGLPQSGVEDAPTRAMMGLPRCGMLTGARRIVHKDSYRIWNGTDSLTYRIQNWTSSFPELQLKETMATIVQLWTAKVNLKINESSTSSANLIVHSIQIDESNDSLTLGYAFLPRNGSIYLNAAPPKPLTVKPQPPEDSIFAGWVLAHEVGHALGLLHSPSTSSVMYPTYNTETLLPSPFDLNNLAALYGGETSLDDSALCADMAVDAMLFVNGHHVVIAGGRYWTFAPEGGLQGGPFALDTLFPGAPERVDAAFDVGNVMFLLRDAVSYKFFLRRMGRTKSIRASFDGLTGWMEAAFYEGSRKVVHFFRGCQYQMFDTKLKIRQRLTVRGKIAEHWPGIPDHVDAATMIDEGRALFVKGGKCYIFEMGKGKVVQQLDCKREFFKCANSD